MSDRVAPAFGRRRWGGLRHNLSRCKMTDEEFDAFVPRCVKELKRKQAALTKQFGLGKLARWDHDQTTDHLLLSDSEGRVRVEAGTIPVGSYSTNSGTWRWAWANPSVPEASRAKAATLCGLFETTGIEIFRMELFEAEGEMPWELAAMAVSHLSALGCYRGVVGQLEVFWAIESIQSAAL